jgi:hypothetical protein
MDRSSKAIMAVYVFGLLLSQASAGAFFGVRSFSGEVRITPCSARRRRRRSDGCRAGLPCLPAACVGVRS